MIKEFSDYIEKNRLFEPGSKVLLAVSGGIDSMVMAHLFIKSALPVAIANCNFSLRDDESDNDSEFVGSFAKNMGIPFHYIRFNTLEYSKTHKVSIEVAARELRYEWFEKCRSENGYDYVAVAHNMNDNLETTLINLTRGTGLTGLSGIKNKNNRIIRPLLFATREMITDYAKQEGIGCREDSSNAETKFSRNKIRHLVVPVLKQINPSVEETVMGSNTIFSSIQEYIDGCIGKEKKKLFKGEPDRITVDVAKLRKVTENPIILYEVFKEFNPTESTIKDLNQIMGKTSGKQILTPTHRFTTDRGQIIITPRVLGKNTEFTINCLDDFKKTGFISAQLIQPTDDYKIPRKSDFASIDFALLDFPLTIRQWKSGDIFCPFGMKGKKKVSDYLIDKKIPLVDKEKILVLVANEEIVWLIGQRSDNRFRITDKTSNILKLRLIRH